MPALRRKCQWQHFFNTGTIIFTSRIYLTITNNDCNVECPHANLSLCITEADPLRSPFCNVQAELTSKTVVYPEDNILHSKFAFIPC